MSKKNYKNYAKYSNEAENNEVVEEATEEVVTEAPVVEAPTVEVEQPVVEETVTEEVVVKETTKVGRVTGCMKLNVRKSPSTSASVVKVIDRNDKVDVEIDVNAGDFYKVSGPDFNGYCMKKFIRISK